VRDRGSESPTKTKMSNSMEQTLEGEDDNNNNNNRGSEQNPNQSQEWETMARLWLSAFSGVKAVSTMEVETWIDSNYSSLPSDLQSMPRSDLIDRLLSIQKYMRLPTQNQVPFSFLSVKILSLDRYLPKFNPLLYEVLHSLSKENTA